MFGVELNFLLEREYGGGPVPPGTIPFVIERCLAQVEARGMTEVGICEYFHVLHQFRFELSTDRMAGASSEIAHLKEAFNRGKRLL